ncbi:MAG TPA: hypothetical protein VKA30_02275, partial [Actinomycetota bacterium]|nr:hypothetical protein [Actinomycetota bacterium]
GFFLDAWAHRNIGRIESIFTPWHAVMYGGFTAAAIWTLVLIRRRHRPGVSWLQAVPVGYGLGLAGMVVFSTGATVDLIGHVLFGFERSLASLISPPHLLIFTGTGLVALSPFRSVWVRPDGEDSYEWFVPAVLPLMMVTSLICQVLLFLTIFGPGAPVFPTGRILVGANKLTIETIQSVAIARIFVTGLILTGSSLLLLRRWRPPTGTLTLMWSAPAALVGMVHGFTPKGPLLVAVAAGLVAEVLAGMLSPIDARWRSRIIGFIAPGTLATAYLALLVVGRHRAGSLDLRVMGGTILITAIGGLVLSALIHQAPAARQARKPARDPEHAADR